MYWAEYYHLLLKSFSTFLPFPFLSSSAYYCFIYVTESLCLLMWSVQLFFLLLISWLSSNSLLLSSHCFSLPAIWESCLPTTSFFAMLLACSKWFYFLPNPFLQRCSINTNAGVLSSFLTNSFLFLLVPMPSLFLLISCSSLPTFSVFFCHCFPLPLCLSIICFSSSADSASHSIW